VFCLFADDAHIFEKNQFAKLIQYRTSDDGSDTGGWLIQLFEVLNNPSDERQTTLDADLLAFPYIDGGLFARQIRASSKPGGACGRLEPAGHLRDSAIQHFHRYQIGAPLSRMNNSG
jgi:hypothetical protein